MPFRSSLVRSAGKLFGVFREADLSLRGVVQSSRKIAVAISATGEINIPQEMVLYIMLLLIA